MHKDLQEGEIILSVQMYNALFDAYLTDVNDPAFIPNRKITYTFYPKYYSGERPTLFHKEFTVVGLHNEHIIINDVDGDAMRKPTVIAYALYFDNTSQADLIFKTGKELNYGVDSPFFKAVITITDIVDVFRDLFLLIAIVLCFAAALILLSFGFTSVRKRSFEIGVMRALGGRIKDVAWIFIIQILLAGVLISLLSSVGLYVTSIIANNILCDSFVKLFDSTTLRNIEVVRFNSVTLAIDIAVVIATTVVSALTPILAIRNVKPMQIIRAKE